MLNIFKKKETKEVYHTPYRPSWEKTAIQWKRDHIARKKAFESSKHDLGTNILPRI